MTTGTGARLYSMFSRWLIGVLVVLAFVPGSAGAVTLVNPDGSVAQPYQWMADRARVPTVDKTLVVQFDAAQMCQGHADCSSPDGWIALTAPDPMMRHVLMHELGHQFDYVMPEWKRQRFLRTLHLGIPWEANGNPASGREIFADYYADCARKRHMVSTSGL